MILDESKYTRAIELWREWNDKINVISRKDVDNIYSHHILHSLAIAKYLELNYPALEQGATFLDVGCGGGFPGIPLAMELPDCQFTLCDSIGKKVKVASAVAEGLGLQNVRCVQARAEELEGQWDWVVSRAVTSLEKFYPWVKGRFNHSILYLKGGDINEEISTLIKKCGIPAENIRAWNINNWLNDEYFAEKFVIEIGKNYLCTPNSQKLKE